MGTAVIPSKTKPPRKTLGIRATAEQSRILAEAAKREHRSVNSFVLQAALDAANGQATSRPRRSHAELMSIIRAAQAEVRSAMPPDRDLVEELLAERRAEVKREELE